MSQSGLSMLIICLSDCAWAVAPDKHKNAVNPMMISILIFIFVHFIINGQFLFLRIFTGVSPRFRLQKSDR